MFTPAFDWTLAVIMGVLAVVFFMGKGSKILHAFEGRAPRQKLEAEASRKYQRAVGFFLLVLAIDEVCMALFPGTVMGTVSIVVTVIALIALLLYLQKMQQR